MSESASGEADSGSTDSGKEFSCPTCGDCFDTKNGRSVHHYQKHGESIAVGEYECDWCGDAFEKHKSNVRESQEHIFCSHKCLGQYNGENNKGENNYNWKESWTECNYCGAEIEVQPVKLEQGQNCYCDRECFGGWISENQYGENHVQWKPEKKNKRLYQTKEWKDLRERVFERDGWECVYCGATKDLNGHHIHPINDGGAKLDPDNVVTLCSSCHQKWEGLYLRPDTR